MDVLLYWDEGVDKYVGNETFHSLKAALDPDLYPIRKVNHQFLAAGEWEETTSLLVIPGGRDIPYSERLAGKANQRIGQFVEQGGSYLGICAGAYYGSASIEFEKGGPLEVCGTRELAFFPGSAKGPALGKGRFCYNSDAGVDVARVHVQFGAHVDSFVADIYYNGGCSFAMPEHHPSVNVLGRYQASEAAAIVECCRGKGKAILCGVHPEVRVHSLAKLSDKSSNMQKIYSKLIHSEKTREKLWRSILTQLLKV